jgi:hypothetical protein
VTGVPLTKKLGIKEGYTVAWPGAQSHFDSLVSPLPPGVSVRKGSEERSA